MTTDITELAQSLKAAANTTADAIDRLKAFPGDELIDLSQHEGEQVDIDITTLNEWYELSSPANVLALVEALEKAQQRIAELEPQKSTLIKFIRDSCYVFDGADEDISDAYVDAITSGLMPNLESVAACTPPLFWVRVKSDGGYEGPIHDSKLEEVRKKTGKWLPLTLAVGVPELESRNVTVKLPKPHAHLIWIQAGHAPDDYWDDVAVSHSEKDRCCDGSERYPVYARWEIEEMLAASGIKVEAG